MKNLLYFKYTIKVVSIFTFFFSLNLVYSQNCPNGIKVTQDACNFASFSPDNIEVNYTYSWSFGDGAMSSDVSPEHTYISLGNGTQSYTVLLVVKDTVTMCIDSSIAIVTVKQVPDPSIIDNPANGFIKCGTKAIRINSTSTTTATNAEYMIDWGDGTAIETSTSPPINLVHNYANNGSFTITSTVTGNNGCKNSATYQLILAAKPAVGIDILQNITYCAPASIGFVLGSSLNFNSPDTKYFFTVDDHGSW